MTKYPVDSEAFRVCDMPERLRPREEISRVGVSQVSDDILLAVLLRSGVRGTNVVDLARGLLQTYGSLTRLAQASVDDLAAIRGMGRVKAQVLSAALEIAKRLTEERIPKRHVIRTPQDVDAVLRERVRQLDVEVFWVLMLDGKNQLQRAPVDVTRGLLNASLVHPREVFRDAIRSSAAAIVLAHNHPSGDLTPSAEDVRITKQLVEAGRIVDIRVLDHVILGHPVKEQGPACFSFCETGVVAF